MLRSATFAQLWQISGCFGEIWGQTGPLGTRNLSLPKFVAVCPKLATPCFHTSFHSRCHWARVARLMTLQRILQYSLRLSWTKTFFQRYLTCTSLGLYNIDRCCFVVRCQNLAKYQRAKVTFYIRKWAKLRATLVQLLDFLSATFWGGLIGDLFNCETHTCIFNGLHIHIAWIHTVWVKKSPLKFSHIFPTRLGILSLNFTRLLYVPIYARLQIFIQLWRDILSIIWCELGGHT